MQPYIRPRVSENGWEGEEETRIPAQVQTPQWQPSPQFPKCWHCLTLPIRGRACAWSKDKRAQQCSLAQGPLVRQTVEMPPLPAQLPRVCKPEGGCSLVRVSEQQQSCPCSYRAHLRHSQECTLPPQGTLSTPQRLLQGVGSQGNLPRGHLQQSHKAEGLEVQLSHWLSQSPCLETTVTTSCTNKGLSARMKSLRAKLTAVSTCMKGCKQVVGHPLPPVVPA